MGTSTSSSTGINTSTSISISISWNRITNNNKLCQIETFRGVKNVQLHARHTFLRVLVLTKKFASANATARAHLCRKHPLPINSTDFFGLVWFGHTASRNRCTLSRTRTVETTTGICCSGTRAHCCNSVLPDTAWHDRCSTPPGEYSKTRLLRGTTKRRPMGTSAHRQPRSGCVLSRLACFVAPKKIIRRHTSSYRGVVKILPRRPTTFRRLIISSSHLRSCRG